MWMDGKFEDSTGEIPIIGAREVFHGCSDAKFSDETVNHNDIEIRAIVKHEEMFDNIGQSAGKVLYLLIKEKTVQNQDMSVVLDKTEYEQGEIINGLISFEKDVYINPNVSIFEFNNNDWKYLGAWSFDGVQYTCCGLMPTCEESFSKNSPLKFTWDQKIVKEELPILESMTKVQAHSGRYKITVVYGEQSACSDGVDVEFVIK